MNILIADKNGRTDSIYHHLNDKINSKYQLVMVSWVEGFVFNDELLNIKDYVLICMCEYGWNYEIKDSHIWGKNKIKDGNDRYNGEEWNKFDDWVRENEPKIIFKRELLKKDVSEKVQPIEYPCVLKEYTIQSELEFNSRPINLFNFWGRSNEERLRIHGDIWLHSYKKGFQVCDNVYYFNNYIQEESGEKWVTLWIPHYARIDIYELLKINNLSKFCISWEGAGFKCFRTSEACVNSIMAMNVKAIEYAWTFDWNETNCIFLEKGKEVDGIEEALLRNDLYEVYKNGVENSRKYMLPSYINHLEQLINKA